MPDAKRYWKAEYERMYRNYTLTLERCAPAESKLSAIDKIIASEDTHFAVVSAKSDLDLFAKMRKLEVKHDLTIKP